MTPEEWEDLRLFGPDSAAGYLGISKKDLLKYARLGLIEYYRISRISFRKCHLDVFRDSYLLPQGGPPEALLDKIRMAWRPFPVLPASCIYFLVRDGAVVYVGQSKKAGSRVVQHGLHDNRFDEVFYIATSPEDLNELEGALIRQLKPLWNSSPGGVPRNPAAILRKYGLLVNEPVEES